ncbi:MAG: aldose 1-epimerase [Paracoccaceae bacterium]|nr:aldose 1-epimerase [Paracoccaceae bacterium]
MARHLELECGPARARVGPELGGAVLGLWADIGSGPVPVLRDAAGPQAGVFDVGMNLLAPFSNRLSGGGFAFDVPGGSEFHPVAPNLDAEPCPIHGDAFLKPWEVIEAGRAHCRLALKDGSIGPFCYEASVDYALAPDGLSCALTLVNTGPVLPFGGGFHPWFPRRSGTELAFTAARVWMEDERHLPTDLISLTDAPAFDFSQSRPLPRGWINNAFEAWSQRATIRQPDLGLEVTVTAEAPLTTAIVYSPSGAADFFCFEPVSHAVDAHNRPGHPGLRALGTGEALTFSMRIGWAKMDIGR